jgi:polysaccharide pyruvyl transferase WcaK-like protein
MCSGGKLVFSGFYGMHNTGDDCFCAISAWGARRYWKSDNMFFLSSTLPVLPVAATALFSPRQAFRGQNKIKMLYSLMTTNTLIFSGGSIFYSKMNLDRALVYLCHRIKRFAMGAIGVSLGPYGSKQSRIEVEDSLKRLSFLAVRDHRSYEEACSMNLPYTPVEAFDLAALLGHVYPAHNTGTHKNQRPMLGFIPCHYERYTKGNVEREQRRERLIMETLESVAKKVRPRIRIFVFNGHSDYGDEAYARYAAGVLGEMCETELIPYSNDPGKVWGDILQCDAVFSVRLHGGIFACVGNVPFVLVEYHQKCSDFLDTAAVPDEWRIGDMELTPLQVGSLLIDMLSGKYSPFPVDTSVLVKKAEKNFTAVPLNISSAV